jgi:hypothetical protein
LGKYEENELKELTFEHDWPSVQNKMLERRRHMPTEAKPISPNARKPEKLII